MRIKKLELKNGYKRFHHLTIDLGDKKWLHKFGRCGRWIGCLTAGTVVLANQERR
jgi:hypothetical protein